MSTCMRSEANQFIWWIFSLSLWWESSKTRLFFKIYYFWCNSKRSEDDSSWKCLQHALQCTSRQLSAIVVWEVSKMAECMVAEFFSGKHCAWTTSYTVHMQPLLAQSLGVKLLTHGHISCSSWTNSCIVPRVVTYMWTFNVSATHSGSHQDEAASSIYIWQGLCNWV